MEQCIFCGIYINMHYHIFSEVCLFHRPVYHSSHALHWFFSSIQLRSWLVLALAPVFHIPYDFDNKLCRLQLEPDLWYLVRSTNLECRAESAWSLWLDANLFPRPITTDKLCQMDKHLDGKVPARICTLADWLDNHLWKSCAICIGRLPKVSMETDVIW